MRDHQLLALIVQKERVALEALYVRYEKILLKIIYSATGNADAAERILTDLFREIWQSPHTFTRAPFVSTAIIQACKRLLSSCDARKSG